MAKLEAELRLSWAAAEAVVAEMARTHSEPLERPAHPGPKRHHPSLTLSDDVCVLSPSVNLPQIRLEKLKEMEAQFSAEWAAAIQLVVQQAAQLAAEQARILKLQRAEEEAAVRTVVVQGAPRDSTAAGCVLSPGFTACYFP